MKKRLIKSVIAVVFLALLGSFTNMSAYADNAPSLTVSPVSERIILVPGEVYNGVISVGNRYEADSNLKFKAFVGSFGYTKGENDKDDYNTPDITVKSNYNLIMDWIELGVEEGEVVPNGTVKIPYTITVPEDVPAGGQYATIVVQDATGSSNANGGGVAIENQYQFASIIYAEVAGQTRDSGEIIENNAPSFLFDGSQFEATSMVKNTGNVHTDAEYTLQVWPLFSGEEICTNEEKPDTSLVLPDTQRYHVQKCNLPSFGIFNIKQTVKIFDQVSTIEKMVIVCPVWLLFLVIFLIVLGIVYLFAKSKKRKND
jgi:hypothetical protein